MQEYKTIAITLAQEAGKIMRMHFQNGMDKEWKADNTPLTTADTAINDLALSTLSKTFPTHSVLGEEGSNLKRADYVWVLDPIDGTIPFSHGVPIFAFSLALTYKGESILGVIYDPIVDRLVYAEKGKGAFCNNKPIHVSDAQTLNRTLIEVQSWKGFSHNLNPLKDTLIQQGTQATTICSIVYAGMLVAIGDYGAALFSGPKPWDAAAVKIIVEEAGGTVTDIQGSEQRYDQPINGFIASNGALHPEILKLVADM